MIEAETLTAEEINLGEESIRFANELLKISARRTSEPRVALVGLLLAAGKLGAVMHKRGQTNAREELVKQAGEAFDTELAGHGA